MPLLASVFHLKSVPWHEQPKVRFRIYLYADILHELEMDAQIKKMDENGCLYSVIKAFSELDLSPDTYDSIKMGYIFENLIGRFFQNVDAAGGLHAGISLGVAQIKDQVGAHNGPAETGAEGNGLLGVLGLHQHQLFRIGFGGGIVIIPVAQGEEQQTQLFILKVIHPS